MHHQSLADLEAGLRKAGIPENYVRRVHEEVNDHLTETGGATDFGETKDLIQLFVDEYRRSTWVGRNPAVGWMIGCMTPLLAFLLEAYSIGAAMAALSSCFSMAFLDGYSFVWLAFVRVILASSLVISSWWLWHVSRLCGRGFGWISTAMFLHCLQAHSLRFSADDERLDVTFVPFDGNHSQLILLQTAIPLLCFGILLLLEKRPGSPITP